MKKRILAIVLVMVSVLSSLSTLSASAEEALPAESSRVNTLSVSGTTYYVSSINGKAGNDGLSEESPYKSLLDVNVSSLGPGDAVLLERGSIFQNEYLHLREVAGSADEPIIISDYGSPDQPKPLINTNGADGSVWHQDYNIPSLDSSTHVLKGDVSSCILLYDAEYIEISNIAMTNGPYVPGSPGYSAADKMDRTGVAGVAQNIGTADHIVLRNLDISKIAGNVYNKHMCNGGIYLVCAQPLDAATGISKYDDVLIEGCTVSEVSRWGIAVGYTCYWNKFQSAVLSDEDVSTYGSTNVVIRSNYVYSAGGDAITLMYCFEPLTEYNVAVGVVREMNSTYYTEPVSQKNGGKNRGGMVAAGIWPWKCKTPVFQYNEVYDCVDNQDAQAWDADYGDTCIYQYNYSANNQGGALMICGVQVVNTIFRYNISQNDGNGTRGVLSWADNHPNGDVYNNVFYIKEGVPVFRPAFTGGKADIYNNIFYYAGSSPAASNLCNWTKNKGSWDNNIFYNFSTIPADANAITSDPLFVNAGSAPNSANYSGDVATVYARSVFDGYKLQEGSPAIDAGKPVTNNGGLDFFGNTLDAMPDIGAYDAGTYIVAEGADITESVFMLDGRTIYVPSQEKNPTSVEEMMSSISFSERATAVVVEGTSEVGSRTVVEDGMRIKVTSEKGSSQYYTIRIKNDYDFAEDYSSAQGNVWFYQYKKTSDQLYYDMPVQDEWGGWMESYNPSQGSSNSWATISLNTNSGDGVCSGPVRTSADVDSAAMAWRAPKSGAVTLSFGGGSNAAGGAATRGNITGGTVYLKITKNGEDVITPIQMSASSGTFITLNPEDIVVEKGDYVRIEAFSDITGPGEITSPGFFITPVISYKNTGDEEAPTAPGSLRISQVQDTKAVVGWDESSDNVGVEGYKIYLNGTLVNTGTGTSAILTDLTKDAEYLVEVVAFDLASNVSEKASGSFIAASENLVYTLPEPVSLKGEGLPLSEDVVNAVKSLNSFTITAQFDQSTVSLASIISVSQSSALANHLSFYVNGARLGYELRGAWGNRHFNVDVLNENEGNSVAMVADSTSRTIKLFANGKLVHTSPAWTESDWRSLKDIEGMDTVTLGYCYRSHVSKYPFTGDFIDANIYSGAFSDEYIIDYTGVAVETEEKEEVKHIFSSTGSRFFRIPALLTLNNGDVMAATDARFGSFQDSPNNLDTAVAFRRGEVWTNATMPLHFTDIADKSGYVSGISASYIDPVIVQGDNNTIYLLATTFPYGTGSGQSQIGTGMLTIDGKKYLALTDTENVTTWSSFTLYIDDNGVVRNAATNEATAYTVDENYNLYQNGTALSVEQKNPSGTGNGTQVPMNIFYKDSALKVFRTAYISMIYSTDNGYTWSAPTILNDLKLDSEAFFGTGPGRGYVTGTGRILIPIYTTISGVERSSVIYSDDNGATWQRGERTEITTDTALNPGKTSEAQFVELPDGTIRMYSRGITGYVGYADSSDGGVTFGKFEEDTQLAYCGNSMVSVINYSKLIDGKPALIMSCPEHRELRKDGIIRIGLISEDGNGAYTVDWKYRYEINRYDDNSEEFIYSCLTELPNGDIGILYETNVEQGIPLNYKEYKLSELKVLEESAIDSLTISPAYPKPSDAITVTVTMKEAVTNPTGLSSATLEILYPGSGLGKGALAFDSISGDNLIITYKGTLPEAPEGSDTYDYIIRMPEWCSHPTVGKKDPVVVTKSGRVNPANKDTLYGMAGAEAPGEPVVESFIADISELSSAGGEVSFTITGTNLTNGIIVKAGSLNAATTGTAEIQTAKLSFDENTSQTAATLIAMYSFNGIDYTGEITITVAAAENTEPSVSSFVVTPLSLSSGGGEVTATINGVNLADGIEIKAGSLTAVTTGTATTQSAKLTMPANTAATATTYTVQYSLDGIVYAGDTTVTISAVTGPSGGDTIITDPELPGAENPDHGGDCPSKDYTDVPSEEHWSHDGIDFVVENGLFKGVSDNKFAPGDVMDRAMLVTVLWRYAGKPLEGENVFKDVEDDSYYADAVAWAAYNNIVLGSGEGFFNPLGEVTREQAVTILLRFADFLGLNTDKRVKLEGYEEADSISQYAREAFSWAVAEGIIEGSASGDKIFLRPGDSATRAQMAAILMRFVKIIPVED